MFSNMLQTNTHSLLEPHTPSHSPTHNAGLPTIVTTKTASAAHYSEPIVDSSGTNYKKQQQKSTRPAISNRAPPAGRGTERITSWNVGKKNKKAYGKTEAQLRVKKKRHDVYFSSDLSDSS